MQKISRPELAIDDQEKIVSVNLGDCLACSGCVTTSEALLVKMQNESRLVEMLETRPKVVISISAQSLASMARRKNMSLMAVYSQLKNGIAAIYPNAFVTESINLHGHLVERD